jgi:DNA-binding transcriptional LysR family regulator
MELRDLEYFAVIAEHCHLGRAADALRLSQPALSKSLRRLEQVLGVRLVNRTPKGVELTGEGSTLLLRIRELRLSLRSVAREIADLSDGRSGHLKVGVGSAVSEQLLSTTFAALLNDAPRTKLLVSVSDNDLMFPSLRNGELDAIVNYFRPSEGLVSEHLYHDEYVVCASAGHRLANRKNLSLADMAQERWALGDPTLISQRWLLDRFREASLPPPRIAFESRSPTLKQRMVASSDLLTFTSRSVVRQFALDPAVAMLPIKELAWPFPISVIYRKETYLPPAVRRFVEIIKATAKAMPMALQPSGGSPTVQLVES